jgi:hypothetical protein
MNTIAATRPGGALARWASLGGVLYVVLFVIGVILLYSGAPDSGSSPARIIAYYSSASHRDRINFGWIVAGLGVFFFLWFLAALRQTIRRLEGGDGFLTALTTIGGAIYAALAFVALAVNAGVRTMSDDTYHHTVYPGLLHAADDASYVIHATGGAAAGAMIIAASVAAMRARAVPTWAGWLGILAGVLGIFSILFFTQAAVGIWILVVSCGMFLRGMSGNETGAAATSA